MAFYSGLTPKDWDSPLTAARKKRAAKQLLSLRAALRDHLGEAAGRPSRNIRIASWNLREFDSASYGRRVMEAEHYIAEIMSHFDLIAVQEVRENLYALKRVMDLMGPGWDFLATDVSPGDRGNDERMVFVFNTNKVWFRDVAGELTLSADERLMLPNSFDLAPDGGLQIELPAGATLPDPGPQSVKTTSKGTALKKDVVLDLPPGTRVTVPDGAQLVFSGYTDDVDPNGVLALGSGRSRSYKSAAVRLPTSQMRTEDLQFARTPFFAQFQSSWLKLGLCTVHIYYGDDDDDSLKMARRKAEIAALTKALADRAAAERNSDAENYFLVLGDFNIVGRDHGTMQALEQNGFVVPEKIREIPAGSNVRRDKFYDQIAIWTGKSKQRFSSYTKVEVTGAGVFDFFKHVFREGDDDPNGGDEAHFEEVMQDEVMRGRASKTYSYRTWRTYQMSDHLPMWIELKTDFADDYLEMVANGGT